MTAAALGALVGVGIVVGFVSGLVGIGGGVLIVPFLYFFYSNPTFAGVLVPLQAQTTMAHATSLFIMVPTAVVGTITYARRGVVVWRAAVPVALFSMLGAAAGAQLAPRLSALLLQMGFGTFLLVTAADLAFGRRHGVAGELQATLPRAALTGVLVGLLSALLGVGGGLVAIPLMMRLMHVPLARVAATSLAIVAAAALSGATSYMLATPGMSGLPDGRIGWVHVLAALPILAAAMITVRLGARANQRLQARSLRVLFAILFGALGLRLIILNVLRLS
ncbi:MAG TPA: sulfite exporter TauE/SafE family protein [Longimicrobiales bacterium]|nr:sulfite exporter TauE/SafE family protein [Longimicrobiales bacterium]